MGNKQVCEKAYLILLGLTTRESRAPHQWRNIRFKILHKSDGKKLSDIVVKDPEVKRLKDQRSRRRIHAEAYIRLTGKKFGDYCPTNDKIYILPHETQKQLFDEYIAFCETHLVHYTSVASRPTFITAFNDCKSCVRLSACKGDVNRYFNIFLYYL